MSYVGQYKSINQIEIFCGYSYYPCDRCALKSINLEGFFKARESLQIECTHYSRMNTVDILPDFNTSTTSISTLYIMPGCNMSIFSLIKLVMELKPQRLSFRSGSIHGLVNLFPVRHQTDNCISLSQVRDSLKSINDIQYNVASMHETESNTIDIDKTMATFLRVIFRSMPMLQTLSLRRCKASVIMDLFNTDMPSVTYLTLTGTDITPNVIQCVANRMKGLKAIYISSIIYNSTRNECLTEEIPLSNVTNLTLHLNYSGVFQPMHIKLNMPNLQTLSISGLNGAEIVDLIHTDMPSVTNLTLTGPDITPEVIQCIGNRMKGLEDINIHSSIYNNTRGVCSPDATPLSNVTNLTLHYSGVFQPMDFKLNMPNLQKLSIGGKNGSKVIDMIQTDLPSVNELNINLRNITSDMIQSVASRMEGLKHISVIIWNRTHLTKDTLAEISSDSRFEFCTSKYHHSCLPISLFRNLHIVKDHINDIILERGTDLPYTNQAYRYFYNEPIDNNMELYQDIYQYSIKITGDVTCDLIPNINISYQQGMYVSGKNKSKLIHSLSQLYMPSLKDLIVLTVTGKEITANVMDQISTNMPALETLVLGYSQHADFPWGEFIMESPKLNIYLNIELQGLDKCSKWMDVFGNIKNIFLFTCSYATQDVTGPSLCRELTEVFQSIKNTSLQRFILLPPIIDKCRHINLSHNRLQDLGRKTFSKASFFAEAETLDASFDNISALYDGCFQGLINLHELDISWNKMTHIDSSHFSDLHNLHVLKLSHNELKTMGECLGEFISFSHEMTTLDMSHNYLSSVYSTQCNITDLYEMKRNSYIYLQNNNYTNLAEIVQIMGLNNRYVNLSSNPIGNQKVTTDPINEEKPTIRIKNYVGPFLDKVFFAENWKSSLTNHLITLKDIMTHTLEANIKITPWLYFDHLPFNKNLLEQTFSPVKVDLLNVSGINTTINPTDALGAFSVLNNLSFNLGDQIYCGCEYIAAYVLLNVLYKSGHLTNPYYSNNWICSGPWEFSGIPLLKAPQKMFKDCWQGDPEIDNHCVSYNHIQSNMYTLDCSTCHLKKLPQLNMDGFSFRIEVILMSNNQISDLCETGPKDINGKNTYGLYFPIPPNVELMDFRNNSLKSICDDFFRKLDHSNHTHLTRLDLRHNQLTTLSKYVVSNQFRLDFVILLEGNRFLCTCDNIWTLKDWIVVQTDEWLPDLKSVECRDKKGKRFVDIKQSDVNCNTSSMWQNVTIGMATTVGILIFIGVYLYRVKSKVKVWLYMKFGWHPLDKGDNDNDITDMDYDAFISYSHEDLAWVRENLLDFLQADKYGFTVCLHERDWPVGVLITENILLSVKHSRRMIMVLSENYLNSVWCRMEFQAAHREMLEGRTKYLIMIAMEGFPLELLPPEMDFYIKTHTYLEAESNWFKEKLIYAMPEIPLTKIRELRSQTSLDMDMEVRARSRRRFPALFYRMFTYRDGRGDLQQDEEMIIDNEEIEDDTRDIENDFQEDEEVIVENEEK